MRLETRTEMLAGVCVRRGTNSENDLGHLQAGHVPRHPQRDRRDRLDGSGGGAGAVRLVQHRGQLGPLRQHQGIEGRRGQ